MDEKRLAISVASIETGETKTIIDIEVGDEFYDWFRKTHSSTNRWSDTDFKRWFKGILLKAWLTLEQGKYKTIYSQTDRFGAKSPKPGDIVTFFHNGYRTRVVASVAKQQVMLEPLWEGDSHGKTSISEIYEILRPRKRVSLPFTEDEEDE